MRGFSCFCWRLWPAHIHGTGGGGLGGEPRCTGWVWAWDCSLVCSWASLVCWHGSPHRLSANSANALTVLVAYAAPNTGGSVNADRLTALHDQRLDAEFFFSTWAWWQVVGFFLGLVVLAWGLTAWSIWWERRHAPADWSDEDGGYR